MTNRGSYGTFRRTDGLIKIGGHVGRTAGAGQLSRETLGTKATLSGPRATYAINVWNARILLLEFVPDIDAGGKFPSQSLYRG